MAKISKTWNDLIIENAERSANLALLLLEEVEQSNCDSESLIEAGKEKIKSYHADITNIAQMYNASLNGDKSGKLYDIDILVHELVRAPRELSGIVSAISNWCAQKQHYDFSLDNSFAQFLAKRILRKMNLEIEPRIIFGTRFSVVDIGNEIIIEVPFVYIRWYSKWLGIGHEIGHIYRGNNREFIKHFDTINLLQILIENLPKKMKQDPNSEMAKLIINWVFRWSGELIADFVAVAACGPGYIVSLILEHFSDPTMTVLDTHPPTDFRVACLVEAGEQFGQNVDSFKDYRESESAIFAKLDRIQSRLINEQLIPNFVKWMIQQPRLCNLQFDWKKSLETRDLLFNGQKTNAPFEIEFGSLALLELERDTTNLYEDLKNRFAVGDPRVYD